MINLICCFFSLFLLFYTHLSAIIVDAPNLEDIKIEIEQLDENALVVFDVDYTIIVPNDRVLGPCGEVYFQEFLKKLRLLQDQGEVLGSTIALQARVSLVDEKILDLLAGLKQKKIKTIALTAIQTGRFGIIPNTEERRVRQLDSFGINFAWSFPSVDTIIFNEFEGNKAPPVFKQGVLASAKWPKGQVLVEFLKQVQWKPSKILFVDDRMKYLESVESELTKEQIPHIAFYYTAALAEPCRVDMKIVNFQFDYLLQNGKWLSDEEADQILKAIHK
jgi:hypothetical protein